jgi:hypothetical protein
LPAACRGYESISRPRAGSGSSASPTTIEQ